ncbi:MAG: acyltransferase [Gemmataceae bacterium]|nr:acyltransferase [Gemmataceae bacterium]
MKHPLFDPLRGVAALWVVVYHLQAGSPAVQNVPLVSAVAGAGFLGVPMFFVISGFCLAAAARRSIDEGKPASDFMARRLWRIFPPFWCSAVLAAFLVPGFSPGFLGWLGVLTLGNIFDPSHERVLDRFKELNGPYWSLAIEVQFYAVVALALLFRRRCFAVLAGATALSQAAYLSPALLKSGAFLAFWLPFGLGLALHEALRLGWTPDRLGVRLRVGGVVALIALMLAVTLRGGWGYGFHPSGLTKGLPNVVAFAGLFTAFLWLAHDYDFAKRAPGWIAGPALLMGAMSYSIYLVHEPVQVLLQSALRPWLGGSAVLFGAGVLAFTLLPCWVFYLLCERPFISTPKKRAVPAPVTGPRPEPRTSRAAHGGKRRRAAASI